MLKNSNWKNKIKPNLSQGERNIRSFLSIFAIMVFFFTLMVFITSIVLKQPILTVVTAVCLLLIFHSWIKLNTRLYNALHGKKKLVPLGESTNRKKMLEAIYSSNTPFGQPLKAKYGPFLFNAPIYIMEEQGWIVYFFISNDEINIRCRTIQGMSLYANSGKNKKLLSMFQKDLVKLFNFIINSKRGPCQNELDYIFENINQYLEPNKTS